tara:strand:- start:1151 stop:1522 length:372 start_codon:yes stop_codon:yes gene_type:complete
MPATVKNGDGLNGKKAKERDVKNDKNKCDFLKLKYLFNNKKNPIKPISLINSSLIIYAFKGDKILNIISPIFTWGKTFPIKVPLAICCILNNGLKYSMYEFDKSDQFTKVPSRLSNASTDDFS